MNRHRASEGCLGIAKGCTSNLAGAEGLKLPSPFTLTVRAVTDRVKAFRKRLLDESGCPAGSRSDLIAADRPI